MVTGNERQEWEDEEGIKTKSKDQRPWRKQVLNTSFVEGLLRQINKEDKLGKSPVTKNM